MPGAIKGYDTARMQPEGRTGFRRALRMPRVVNPRTNSADGISSHMTRVTRRRGSICLPELLAFAHHQVGSPSYASGRPECLVSHRGMHRGAARGGVRRAAVSYVSGIGTVQLWRSSGAKTVGHNNPESNPHSITPGVSSIECS